MTGRMRLALVGGVLVVVAIAIIPRTPNTVPRIGSALPEPALTVTASTTTVASACDLMIDSAVESIDRSDAGPGDVICLVAGTRGPLRVKGLAGTEVDPIVVVNHDGITTIEGDEDDYAGIDIKSSSHLIVSGAGVTASCGAGIEVDDQECGIVIRGTGRGIAATARSGHIAVDHVEVTATSHSGIFMRSAARHGTSRQEWTQRGTRVTDTYLHGVGTEGVYLGSSAYAKGLDPLLEDVEVSRNLVVESGWDGIQVGSAVAGCVIRDNLVVRAGIKNQDGQNTGIINNRGSVCDIHANVVVAPAARGIYVQGNGGNVIANNVVVQPGRLQPERGDGITVTRGSNRDRSIDVLHNTIVGAARAGIRFRNDVGDASRVRYNLVVATPEPVDLGDGGVDGGGNVDVDGLDDARFFDPWGSDFRLLAGSPAIDVGDVGDVPVPTDLVGTPRPQGDRVDAGAFEHR